MTVEEKPDVTYADLGGVTDQIEKIREVVELPLLQPERFVQLGIDPPKGVLLFGPPGTGKTLLARAVANRTDACFIRVIGSELVQKYEAGRGVRGVRPSFFMYAVAFFSTLLLFVPCPYDVVRRYVGEGARMVRELFQMARSKKACIVFFDEVDAIGGARFDDGAGGDNEVQRTMLQIVTELDGFDARGNIKVLMATNRYAAVSAGVSGADFFSAGLIDTFGVCWWSLHRPDTLDPALLRPGRLDRKIEFTVPDLEGRTKIFKIHSKSVSCEKNIRWELLARLCPNTTGAEIRSVCTEAGMFAIRARRKVGSIWALF